MNYLVFDVETTNLLPKSRPHPSRSELYPHIVQIGWMAVDEKKQEKRKFSATIRPNGYKIPAESVKWHRITTEKAMREGKPLLGILQEFEKEVKKADYIVAHNAEFDSLMVAAECYRSGIPDFLRDREIHCTMKSSTDLCRLPGKYGFKYPKLAELYYFLFRKDPANKKKLHDALEDVKVTQQCWEKLRRRHTDLSWITECRSPTPKIKRARKFIKVE